MDFPSTVHQHSHTEGHVHREYVWRTENTLTVQMKLMSVSLKVICVKHKLQFKSYCEEEEINTEM